MLNKKTLDIEVDGHKLNVAVLRPNQKALHQAGLVYNRAFREAVEAGSLLRQRVEQAMREQGLWDDDKKAKHEAIMGRLLSGEKRLAAGGGKLSDAYQVALDMRRARVERQLLRAEMQTLDDVTAEAVAEQARFNHLVAHCTVYSDTGKPYFESVDDYLGRDSDPVSGPAARELAKFYYGLEDDLGQSRLPEIKFLKKYGFVDDKLRLIRKSDGHLIDDQGRLIDEEGRLVNEEGQWVDHEGNLLNKDFEYQAEFVEFDDDMSPPSAALVSVGVE